MAYSLSFSKSILVLIFISDKTRRGETEFISTKVMSELLNIPKPTLSVILGNLMRAGILQTKEGVNGGVRMAKGEANISLLDILIAIENEKPLFQTEYDLNVSGARPDNAKKSINAILKDIEKKIKEDMKKTTLKDILNSM
ncbi:Rrf2 family transcriptional regulator [Flavobacterium sp. ZT3R18]|uniref:RrF2 family transcriptional regulator n=1 Tax=Flavobacterium sp. ZT3R18 TaxID=2594429 RepID=UPI00117B0EDE|nr:Rrf2 family transcriptional regulator [Flavobacterium sp. ZT3R18]TRX37392.1 Rrf2 family transcriptional regulator [Flavobacterium sp. ZT3R18]